MKKCGAADSYSPQYLKYLLKSHFGDRIIFTDFEGKNSVFCFRETANKFVYDTWHASRQAGKENDSVRVVKAAAKIIRDAIRSRAYDMEKYFMNGDLDEDYLVPDLLRLFLSEVIVSKTQSRQTARSREALSQAIVQACRPRSYVSPILLHISTYLHVNVGSKLAIDLLHSLGLSSSYGETRRFVISLLNSERPEHQIVSGLVQYAWDNADHNTATATGHGTFHNMGGIQCSTPKPVSSLPFTIPRLKGVLKVDVSKGHIPVKMYVKPRKSGLKSLTIEDVSVRKILPAMLNAMKPDVLWIASSTVPRDRTLATPTPSWSGFMDIAHNRSGPYDVSSVEFLPFINLDPTNLSCIYTALDFSLSQCQAQGQRTAFVSFDLPLYMKAMDIVHASEELRDVIPILGGFHLMMSYLGAVGSINDGSGLEELLATNYAKNTVPHILSGHAYSRAVRGHFIAQQALGMEILKQNMLLDDPLIYEVTELYEKIMTSEKSAEDIVSSETAEKLVDILVKSCDDLSKQNRTAKLWVEYFHQIEIARLFLQSLRSGDWDLYLDTMKAMLPYLHAANHLPYAKGIHLHLQKMSLLEEQVDPDTFEMFSKRGLFVVRHTDRFFTGTPMDYTIETKLMRYFKTCGVTRGRGITESTISQIIAAFPLCVPFCQRLEDFCGVRRERSEQHVELRPTRVTRHQKHLENNLNWLQTHSPFEERPVDALVSLSTGAVADDTVNPDQAWEIGCQSIQEMHGKNFADVKLTKKKKVKSFAAMRHNINIQGEEIVINPHQLLHRIICALDASDGNLSEYLEYELASRPPSLFDEVSLRKTDKSALAAAVSASCPPGEVAPAGAKFVVDGGMLLRAVVWPRPATYAQVCAAYQSYVLRHYGPTATVVFDGYGQSELSPKGEEQRRRSSGKTSPDLLNLRPDQHTCTAQANFLGNGSNKARLIEMLTPVLESSGVKVLQDPGDADQLIVATALNLADGDAPVVVAATDTDIFAMLAQRCPPESNVHMYMPGTCGRPSKVHDMEQVQQSLGAVKEVIMFAHAMSGSDSTSAFYGKGKVSILKLLQNDKQLREDVKIFNSPEVDVEELLAVGERVILALYNGNPGRTLNQLRYDIYSRQNAKKDLSTEFRLQSLPPTSAAARPHILRVYRLVQEYHGRLLDPLLYGWKRLGNRLVPIPCEKPPAPESLLRLIRCGCTKGCNAGCSCRRIGLTCRSFCMGCNGNCSNAEPISLEDGEDAETVDDPDAAM